MISFRSVLAVVVVAILAILVQTAYELGAFSGVKSVGEARCNVVKAKKPQNI